MGLYTRRQSRSQDDYSSHTVVSREAGTHAGSVPVSWIPAPGGTISCLELYVEIELKAFVIDLSRIESVRRHVDVALAENVSRIQRPVPHRRIAEAQHPTFVVRQARREVGVD